MSRKIAALEIKWWPFQIVFKVTSRHVTYVPGSASNDPLREQVTRGYQVRLTLNSDVRNTQILVIPGSTRGSYTVLFL